jgi:hypothetical protein
MAPLGDDGRMTDFSKVAPSGFAVIPFFAEYINSPGEIVGSAIERDPRQLPRLQTNPMRRRWQILHRLKNSHVMASVQWGPSGMSGACGAACHDDCKSFNR